MIPIICTEMACSGLSNGSEAGVRLIERPAGQRGCWQFSELANRGTLWLLHRLYFIWLKFCTKVWYFSENDQSIPVSLVHSCLDSNLKCLPLLALRIIAPILSPCLWRHRLCHALICWMNTVLNWWNVVPWLVFPSSYGNTWMRYDYYI